MHILKLEEEKRNCREKNKIKKVYSYFGFLTLSLSELGVFLLFLFRPPTQATSILSKKCNLPAQNPKRPWL